MQFKVVIPARYDSVRFPGKVLVDIQGKPMIDHVYQKAINSGAEEVLIATDDQRVLKAAQQFGANACMTSNEHQSGTDRIAEVAEMHAWSDDVIVVNVQGDEPLIPSENIAQVAEDLNENALASISTLLTPFKDMDEVASTNNVKVATDKDGYALYFSRAVIPHQRDAGQLLSYQRHVGIYAYTVGFLKRFVNWSPAPIEQIEKLEQLRVLWNGEKIHTAQALISPPHGVDTEEDLANLIRLMN